MVLHCLPLYPVLNIASEWPITKCVGNSWAPGAPVYIRHPYGDRQETTCHWATCILINCSWCHQFSSCAPSISISLFFLAFTSNVVTSGPLHLLILLLGVPFFLDGSFPHIFRSWLTVRPSWAAFSWIGLKYTCSHTNTRPCLNVSIQISAKISPNILFNISLKLHKAWFFCFILLDTEPRYYALVENKMLKEEKRRREEGTSEVGNVKDSSSVWR